MKDTEQILKETGVTKVAFAKYREMGLVDSYVKKAGKPGKRNAGFSYLYEDRVIQQINDVKRKMEQGITLSRQQKERWERKSKEVSRLKIVEVFSELPAEFKHFVPTCQLSNRDKNKVFNLVQEILACNDCKSAVERRIREGATGIKEESDLEKRMAEDPELVKKAQEACDAFYSDVRNKIYSAKGWMQLEVVVKELLADVLNNFAEPFELVPEIEAWFKKPGDIPGEGIYFTCSELFRLGYTLKKKINEFQGLFLEVYAPMFEDNLGESKVRLGHTIIKKDISKK